MVGAIASLVMAGISIYQMAKSSQDAKKAEQLASEYEREKITNPFLGLSQYPAIAYASQTNAANTELATTINAARQYGRGLSVVPSATQKYEDNMTKLAANMETYGLRREEMIAQGEVSKQQRIAAQEDTDIQGLASLYGMSKYNQNEGLVSLGNAITYGADAYDVYNQSKNS